MFSSGYLLFLLPIVFHWDNYDGLYFMQDGAPHILLFLFVHGLTTILLLGGLGVENQQIGLHELPNFVLFFLFFIFIFLVGFSQRGSSAIKNENT
jgi:hypothetical protein